MSIVVSTSAGWPFGSVDEHRHMRTASTIARDKEPFQEMMRRIFMLPSPAQVGCLQNSASGFNAAMLIA